MLSVKASRTYTLPSIQRFMNPFPHPYEKLSIKLRHILTDHYEKKTVSRTFGMMDPVQVVQAAPYVDTVYVSGWQCAAAAAADRNVGPDFADYPSNTVPLQVERLLEAQVFHSKRLDKDIIHPIIADADVGFGGLTSVMRTTKLLIKSGSSGIHLEDQSSNNKKCGHLGNKVLVPMRLHIERLRAARLQADLMGSSLVLISRTDAESATHIDSDIDSRDQPYIIGKLSSRIVSGEFTLPEAIQKVCHIQHIPCPPLNYRTITEMREILTHIAPGSTFNTSVMRTSEGFYPIRGGTDYAIRRAQEFSAHADMQWCETSSPDLEQAKKIAKAVDGCLAYNLSPSFNWNKYIPSETKLRDFSTELGELRFCWQFNTVGMFHVTSLATTRFAKAFQKDGMLAYVKDVQNAERDEGVDTYKHQEWSGVKVSDELLSLITDNRKSGDGSTEKAF